MTRKIQASYFFLCIYVFLLQNASSLESSNKETEFKVFNGQRLLKNITNLMSVNQEEDKITMIFAGDIMSDRGVGDTIKANKNNYNLPYHLIKSYLDEADIKVANLEAQITNSTKPKKRVVECESNGSGGHGSGGCCGFHCFFQTDDDVLDGIVDYAGFNVLLLENNHIEDYEGGREDTIVALDEHNTAWTDYNHPLKIENYKGCNLEFFNYEMVRRVNPLKDVKANMLSQLAKADQDSFKLVFIHAGEEYSHHETEEQREIAYAAIDSGAHIVLFGHPHVVLGQEVYKDRLIFWSLGNFVFDQFFNDRVNKFLMVRLELSSCKNISQVEKISGTINNSSQPHVTDTEILDYHYLLETNKPPTEKEVIINKN